MGIKVPPDGPPDAKIFIVGEAPGADEVVRLKPFIGASGMELERMLGEAKISRSECFITNVARERPPDNDIKHFFAKSKKAGLKANMPVIRGKWVTREIVEGIELLKKEIQLVRPNIIIAFGNTSMWALTGEGGEKIGAPSGIKKWRGSMLYENLSGLNCKVIPTYHPAFVLRTWNIRGTTVSDIRKAATFRTGKPYPIPDWRFVTRPSFQDCKAVLLQLLNRLNLAETILMSFDIETVNGHIHSAGIAWSKNDALCIPLISISNKEGYWNQYEEAELIYLLYLVLTHKNVEIVGQNIIYDCQYTWRHWHFVPRVVQDTMISQHSMFSDLPKSLAFQASLYCQYFRYWKDESKAAV